MGALRIKQGVQIYVAYLIRVNSVLFCLENALARDNPSLPAPVRTVLEATRPLSRERGSRLPLFVLPISNALRGLSDELTKQTLRGLAERGIGYTMSWDPHDRTKSLAEGLRIGNLARAVGLPVAVDATGCLDRFYDGSAATLHRDEHDEPFADLSFDPGRKMGCPKATHQAIRGPSAR